MKNYFRLHPFCAYYFDGSKGCIYNVFSKEMITVEKKYHNQINNAQNNLIVDENSEILKQLEDYGLGDFYKYPVSIEEYSSGIHPRMSNVHKQSAQINKAYFIISDKCSLNCIFCDSKMNRKTGCKLHSTQTLLKYDEWKNITNSLLHLGCRKIIFTGGDPLCSYELLRKIIIYARKLGITDIELVTNGTLLNQEHINFLTEMKVTLNLQIVQDINQCEEETFMEYLEKVVDNTKQIDLYATILISKYNDSFINSITDKLDKYNIKYKMDYLYNLPENDHYSKKYIDQMKDSTNRYGIVTPITYSHNKKFSNCFFGQITILPNGDLTPCPMMDDYILGNSLNDDIIKIVSGNEYQKLIRLNKDRVEGCSKCSYRYNCFDCRAIEYNVTKKIYTNSICDIGVEVEKI